MASTRRAAIDDAMSRLAWAISTGQRDAFAQCHVPAATWVDEQGRTMDALAWFDGWRAMPVAPGHQVWVGNVRIIEERADEVIVDSDIMTPYFGQTMVPATLVLAVAQAQDRYVSTADGWQLASRQLRGWPFPKPAAPSRGGAPAPTRPQWQPPDREDHARVMALYADYAWMLDTGDAEAFVQLLTPDVLMTDPGGRYEGHAQVLGFLRELHGHNHTFPGRQHWIGSPWLRQTAPDRIEADVFVCVPATYADGAINLDIVGCYQDVLVRVDGRWKFRQRLILPWTGEVLSGFPRYAAVEGVA